MANPSSSTGPVALSITPETITVVRVQQSGSGAGVVLREQIDTPHGAVSETTIHDVTRLGQALRALWRQARIRERSVTLVLPRADYSMRTLRLPEIPERDRRAVVRGELEQTGAIPYGRGAFDFLWKHEGKEAQANIYAYFTSDGVVNDLRNALQYAGLRLEALEPHSLALMRAYLSAVDAREPVAILCPAEKHCDLAIHDGREVRLLRRISLGAEDVRREAERRKLERPDPTPAPAGPSFLGLKPGEELPVREEAEAPLPAMAWSDEGFVLEEQVGSAPAPSGSRQTPPERQPTFHGVPLAQDPEDGVGLAAAAGSGGSSFVAEITRSIAYYAREYPGEPQPRALVVLGTDGTPELIERALQGTQRCPVLAVNLRETVRLPPPLAGAVADPEGEPVFAAAGAACGAAGIGLGVPLLDLSQQERDAMEGPAPRRQLVVASLTGAGVWLVISITAALILTVLEMEKRAEVTRLQLEMGVIKAERAPILRAHELHVQARAAQQKSQVPAGEVLGRVAASSIPGIALDDLAVETSRTVKLSGRALDTRSIERFALELTQGEVVRRPVIEMIQKGNNGRLTFRLAGSANGRPALSVSASAAVPPAPQQ
ncbi:MAG: hypothetical protein ACK47B_01790 [Armatimonadota bacterium]